MVKKKATRKGSKKKAVRSTRRETPIQKIEALIQEFSQLDDDKYEEALSEMEQRAADAINALKETEDEDD